MVFQESSNGILRIPPINDLQIRPTSKPAVVVDGMNLWKVWVWKFYFLGHKTLILKQDFPINF